ncbi:unnamed protein product [Camellia sinensis]
MLQWRKDIERGYTCIPTTYTKAGAVVNAKLHDKYHKMLDEILEIAANDNGKHEVLDLGLIEIKDRVRKDQSSSASHVPPSTSNAPPSHSSPKSPSARSTTKASMSRKMLSPMVARRRDRPCTKRKVSKVDEIVNRLKEKSKRPSKAQGRTVPQCQPRKLNFPSTDDMQYNTYHDPATQTAPYYFPCMDGTQQSMYVPVRFSPMQTVDNIGGTSHAQSGMVNNIHSQSSTIAENFVDLNVDTDPNVPFFFLDSH